MDPPQPPTAPFALHAGHVDVIGATPDEQRRLAEAIARFRQLGLVLPALIVSFHDDGSACKGSPGVFSARSFPWHISICDSDLLPVYEHELAHAWLRAHMTDDVRNEFMNLRGYAAWSDHSLPWNQRGVEGAAFVIQQGLSGLPLAPVLSPEIESRLTAFELLTGRSDPRLQEWTRRYHPEREAQSELVTER